MPNGETYSVFQYTGLFHNFQRHSGNRVFIYDTGTGNDELWYDFSLAPGDTVNAIAQETDTTFIFFSYFRVGNIFGADRGQWHFWVDYSRQLIDYEEELVVTDSIGLTQIWGAFGPLDLRGAVINGVTYGDITSIVGSDLPPITFSLYQNYPTRSILSPLFNSE